MVGKERGPSGLSRNSRGGGAGGHGKGETIGGGRGDERIGGKVGRCRWRMGVGEGGWGGGGGNDRLKRKEEREKCNGRHWNGWKMWTRGAHLLDKIWTDRVTFTESFLRLSGAPALVDEQTNQNNEEGTKEMGFAVLAIVLSRGNKLFTETVMSPWRGKKLTMFLSFCSSY